MQREPDFIFERQTGGSFLPRSRSAPTPTRKASANQPLELLALEDRVLYSAVPIDLPDAAPNEPSNLENLEQQVNDLIHWTSLLAAADLVEPGATSETIGQSAPEAGGAILVVVDQGIADYQTLLDDIRNQLPEQHSLLLIDSTGDGWLQLNQYLSQHQGIQQVHLFSHAASGQLLLGNQSLQIDDLFNDDSAAIWQRALDPNADVFLYGCQLAADSAGEQFLSQFAMFSGADVAASIDQTGNSNGADWDLEFSVGLLNSESLFEGHEFWQWEGSLDAQTLARAGTQELSGMDRGSPNAVAVNSDGTYVIVWSEQVTGQGWDVLACRFNADGTQNGSIFTVNQSTNGDQRFASVDLDSSGRFVVTWTGIDNGNDGILARLYASNGTALTSEFVVNTYRPSAQFNSSVSMAPDGRFVIAWEGNGSEDSQGIFAQRYDSLGNAIGSQIFVNSSATGNQENPTVSMNSSGAFVIAWNDETSFRYQRFDSNGNKLDQNGIAANEVTVSSLGTARRGDILLNNDGTVVSTWQEYDATLWDVFYRTDAMNGTPLFSKTLVLGSTADQFAPSIDGSGSGDFIISWEGRETDDPNGGVFYRLYNSSGLATPYTFLANSNYTTNNQGLGSVASTGLSNYVVVWSGNSANDATDIGHNNVRNAIPVAVNDSPTLPEAGGYNNANLGVLSGNNVLLNDTDVGDTLTVVGIVGGIGGISTSNVGTPLVGSYGTITLQADGTFSYSLNQSNAAVQGLRTSLNTLTETFTYTVRDSGFMVSTATLTITITGQNDAPTSVADSATAIEASGVNNGTAGTNPTGNVLTNDTDPDSGDTKTVTGVAVGVQPSATGSVGIAVNGTYGSITISSAGAYTYTVNNANASVQALRTSSQTLTDVFTYTMNDAGGLSSTNQLTVTIQGANDTPTINAITTPNIAENSANGTVVTTASATEVDSGDTTTFSLTNDAGGRFAINSSTGVITVANSSLLNFESATSHSITIRVTDLAGANSSQNLTINLTDINEFAISAVTDTNVATNTINELAANGSTVGITASATDQDGSATVTYSLDDSAGGRFAINSSTGVVTKAAALDFESATSHTIIVRATSSDGSSSTANFTISVTDFNEFSAATPVDNNSATNEVIENSPAGTLVGLTAFSTDSDATNNTISYSLVNDAQGRFTINSATGVVSLTGNSVNYEQATSHTITVRATSADGSFADQSFLINVLNAANEINGINDTNAAADTMAENAALGTSVITAQTSHPDNLPITYSLTNNAGGLFGIDASTGVVTLISALNYETGTSHTITVRADATDGSFAVHNFTITVQDVNEFNVGSISDTNAAANSIAENSANGVTVGLTAFATDGDGTTNTITYSLDNNAGGRFAINSSTGVVTVANGTLLNFEAATSHTITVRATSADSSFSTANFTINVTDVNEAPTITNSATYTLPATNEDTTSSGTLASTILSAVGWADVDTGALSGLAITGVTGSGTWQFSTDGASWTNFGTVSGTNALLITSTTQVRYTPNTQNAETATFTFKAWDRTTGTASVNGTARYASTASSGGSTAYSTSNATASMTVNAVNDAPTITNAATHNLTATNEDTTSSGTLASAILTGVTWNDVDTGASSGLAITGTTGSGVWQYSTDGVTWANFGTVSSTNALLITSTTRVRYTPSTQNAETATFTFKAWDQTSDIASTNATPSYASTASAGGAMAYSLSNATASISVTAVNDAPTINNSATHNLASTTEDATSSGTLASAILSGVSWADVDTGALSGLAITATTGSGNWQYSTNGTTWTNFGAVSSTNALLITSSTQVRYTPSTQNAETATFSFKAWDQSSGTASTNVTPSYASTASAGGTTAFSTNNSTASISVTSVNDAPTISNGSNFSFTSVNEDTTSAGVLASTILTNASWADVDAGAVNGMAITGATGAGTWQYSTDGSNWSNFGAISGTNSLLINSATQIRYIPDGQNGETATFTYKAWDQTSGTASTNATPSYASTTTPGGSSAFSINNATGQIVVTSVNDAPTITNNASHTLNATTEDATSSGTLASAILSGVTWADVDTGALSGLAITGTTGSGTWQYSTNGSTWSGFGAVSSTNALLITSATQVRYTPGTQNAETATFSFKAWDQTSGTASTNATPSYASTATAGGTTAFSTSNATASMSVTAVNDAPTISSGAQFTLASVNEDTTSAGALASTILSSASWADVDTGALSGMAITGVTGNGTWQYSTDGTTWANFGAVSGTNALLITSTSQIRYVPNGQNGETATFTYKAWDQTSGTASTNATPSYASTASAGGTTAFSTNNATGQIVVTSVNDAPTIGSGAIISFTSVNEDTTSTGVSATSFLSGASWADVDTGAVSGMAITSATGNGNWQYSTDGITWANFGSVSGTNSLLITSTSQIRYVPNGQNGETATFTYKAWDQTSGTASTNATPSYASTASAGGTTAFSTNNATGRIIVTSVNDAPTITNNATHTLTSTTEDATSSSTLASAILSGVTWADVDTGALSGLAITGTTGSGNWQYSTDGSTWNSFGAVSSTNALLITSATQVRYTPGTQNAETATFSFKAWDQTSGTASTNATPSYASTATAGGTTAFSTSNATASMSVTAVNDAPTISSGAQFTLASVNEDTTSAGALASTILSSASWADVDTGALSGMAITGVTGNGTWQYSTDGTTWANFGAISGTNALLITSTSQIRYVPNGQNGETATFTYKAWDQTSGTASTNATPSYASTASAGGTTAFSTNNATGQIVVTSVNDAPSIISGVTVHFSAVNEDSTSAGMLANAFLVGPNWNDVDTGALGGLAITATVGSGNWQYSTDGVTWANFGAVSGTNALLITSTSQIRYVPNGQNGETATFTYKAWDQTSGTASTNATPSYASTATAGGTTAFSTNNATGQIAVTSVNDAPTITNNAIHTLTSTTEDATSSGTLASVILSGVTWADVDTGALSGLAITGTTGSGTWQYSTNGSTWANFGSVSSTNALLITSTTQVRYIPSTQNAETATFSFKAWDQTSGTASTNATPSYASTASAGGTTAFSTSNATASMSVTAVNDAPTISNGGLFTLTSVNEDTTSAGALASTILSGASWADFDTGALSGMAITGVTGNGTWQYSTDGTTWANFGAVSGTNALLITSTSQIRYVPNGQNGEIATFTYKAWDQTSGTASTNATASYASTASAGGTSAFSTNNATGQIVVTSVNDAPSINSGVFVNLSSVNEDTTSVELPVSAFLSGPGWADVDTGALWGMAITGATGNGNWQYSTDGIIWANFGSVSSTNSLLINATSQIRYVPDGQNGETATFTYKAWDQTSGTASTNATPSYASTASAGGTTAFSTNNATGQILVTSVNDAPTITNNATHTLTSTTEDATSSGTLASAILSGVTWADVDTGALSGPAITGTTGSGNWQYSTDGSTWNSFGAVSSTNALLITSTTQVRYTPGTQNAETATFSFKAWDQTSGTASTNATPSYASTASAGGTTAFSTSNATASMSVTAVNDSPNAASDNAIAVEAGGINNNTAGTNPTGNVLTNDTDPDAGDTKTVTGVAAGTVPTASGNVAAAVTGTYGSINIAADGTFHYTVDNNNPAVQALRTSANTLTDTFTYTMRDAAGLTSTTQISITIQGANDAPVDLATTGLTITENASNGTTTGTITRSDLDTGDGATYSLLDSAGGRFAINSSTGVVTVANGTLIDRETAAAHNITVRVTDTAGAFYDEVFTVNVTDADEFDVSLVSDSNAAVNGVSENAANGTQTGVTASASDADATNNSITYSLDNSAGGRFAIDSSTGVVTVANGTLLDREAAASHSIVIRATSSDGSFSTQSFTINLNDVDEFDIGAITDANATPNSIAENSANGTTVSLTAAATDADATNNTITFSLDDSAGGRFAIDASTGVVSVADSSLLNYEAATSHSITIRATSSDGSTSVQTFIVNLSDVDEFDVGQVSDGNPAANTIAENSAVGTLAGITAAATDPDATTNVVTYSLDDSAGGRFAINSSTGVVTVANSGLLNFEAASSHSITIRATSADGSSSTQIFTINLTNVNESPTAVNDSAVAVEAGGIANATPGSNPSGNVLANDSDPDSGDTKSIVGVAAGTPASALGQVGTSVAGQYGTLVLQANGSYNFIVDNSNWAVQTLRTSSDSLTDTFTYTMTDAGGQQSTAQLSIQIVGANDNPAEQRSEVGLAINQGSSNNQYVLLQNFNQLIGAQLEFTIRVSISTTQSQFFLFSYATNSDDNEFRIYAYDGTLRLSYDDIDWHTGVSSSIVSDGQRHEMTVVRDSWTGGLKLFIDGDLAAQISGFQTLTTLGSGGTAVLAQEQDSNGGSFNTSQFFRGTIWDLSFYDTAWSNSRVANESGTVSNAADLLGHWSFNTATGGQITDEVGGRNGTLNSIFGSGWTPGTPALAQTDWLNPINENPAANLSVGFLTAYDIDAGDSLTWHLSNDAGGRFAINSSTGEITVANSSLINRETAASYQITAVATDLAGGTLARTYTITVNDVDEFDVSTIVDGNATANQVAENSANGTLVGLTAQAFDADATNNSVTYTLTDSAGGRFAINSTTGAVRVANGGLLNRENAASHTITVRATSADGSSSLQSFTIDVTDADEFDVGPLSDINTASNSVNENAANGTLVGITASASDADSTNNSITYSLDNSAGGRFNIDASTGVVSVADSSLLDREAASSHAITIRATSEDGSFSTESYVINLNDVDEFDVSVPVDSNASTNAISEGAANGLVVGITATASDTDATTNTIIWSLDDSAGGRFAINANTGVVTVANGSLLDRETASSHAITVRATSADGSSAISTFTIQVNNINESPIAVADSAIAIEAGGLNNTTPGLNPVGNVLLNDSDIDSGDSRVVVGVRAGVQSSTAGSVGSLISGLYGSLTLNSDGSYTYTIDNTNPQVEALRNSSAQLVDTFSYTIRDADGLESTTQLAVTVQGANDTPHSMWSETGLTLNSGASNNQYLQIENLGNLLSGEEFTLRLSFSTTHPHPYFLSYASTATPNDLMICSEMQKLTIYINDTQWRTNIATSLLTDGERHELSIVRTAVDGGVKVYIDGVLRDSRVGLRTGYQVANAGSLVLGLEQDSIGGDFVPHQIFRGTYWDLAVHSTAWSGGRVQLNTGHTFHDLPDLRGHWDFELSGGDTVFDQIGTRHGSLRSIPAGGDWIAGTPEQVRADWKPNLLENAANGTVVANPRASDIDQGERLTWSLTDNPGGRFAIDSSTGQITVADSSQLNFEHLRSHQIQVRVTDEGGLFREETYQIHLTDVQETDVSIPVDDNLAPNQVLENSNTGSLVGLTAWAIDQDGTTNQVTYSLDDDAGGRFTINSSTGVVTVANGNLLDREDAASHEIVVRATSEDGTTATQRFTIAVGDVSEFAIGPISDRNPSDNLLRESATTGTAVGITAQASDPDATNNTVRYSLDDNAGGRFVIDENTGGVSVAGDGLLDYEAVSTVSIIVRASSSDGSFVTQTFVINLIDVDEFDTGPISDFDTTDNMVYENSEIGTYIGLAAFAQDADATNSGIVYRLADDDGGRFSIDSTTGRVFTNAMLDFETDGQYRTIQVAAVSEDGSNMIRSFQIEIADIFKESFATYAGMNVEFSPTEILTSSRDENYQITNLTLENAPAFGDLMIVGSTGARMVSARELSSLSISPNERLRFISPSTTQGNVTLGYTAMNSEGRERTGTVTIMVEAAAPPAPPPPTISFTNNDSGSSSSSERAPSGDSPSERSVAVEQDATASSSSGGEASGSAAGGAVMAVGPISGSGGTAGAGFEFAEDGEASERTADTGSGKSSGDANQQGEKTAGESGLFTSIANLMQTSGADSFVSAADSGVVTRVFATAAAIEQKLINSTQFTEYLSKLETALQQTPVVVGFEMPAYASAGASLFTVGYVAWLIRGGVLLTSFMSSLPSWQSFDPLPILENAGSGDGDSGADGSDSSIAELVDSEQPVPLMSGTAG